VRYLAVLTTVRRHSGYQGDDYRAQDGYGDVTTDVEDRGQHRLDHGARGRYSVPQPFPSRNPE
jgi:hypothetical protein